MDGMMRRREMVQTGETEDYVRDGLIFFLDGLNRGGVTGQWTDIIGGYTFTLTRATEYDNGVSFTSGTTNGGYGKAPSDVSPAGWASQTIECACSGAQGSQWLFSGPRTDRICLAQGAASNGNINTAIQASGTQIQRYLLPIGTKLISINADIGIGDLQTIARGTNDGWSAQYNGTFLGKRNTGNYQSYTGTIYAIRIYSRKLTEDEMKQNQRVDMRRYGITI